MKKEKSPVLVVSCIFLLLLLIVLPPVFRALIPDTSQYEDISATENKISLLQCSRTFSSELYQVNIKVKYLNQNIISNTITYTKLESLPENYQEVEANIPVAVLEEYSYLSKLNGIQKQGEEPNPILVLTEEVITANSEDETVKLYFQEDISEQTNFYKQRGYSCNVIES